MATKRIDMAATKRLREILAMYNEKEMMEKKCMEYATKMGGMPKSTIPKRTFKEVLKSKDKEGDIQLDAHCWCEDEEGNVVFDPNYEKFDYTKKLFNLTNETCYKKFDTLLQKLCFKSVEKQVQKVFDEVREQVDKETNRDVAKIIINHIEEGGEQFFNQCFSAGIAYKTCNPSVNLVCGSAGWIGKDGEPHWEYG